MLLLARLNPFIVELTHLVELSFLIVISGFEFIAVSLLVVEGFPLINSNDLFLWFCQLRKLILKSRCRLLNIDLESRYFLEVSSLLERALVSQLREFFTNELPFMFNPLNFSPILSI